ncbi:MAG: bifunctional metallophosphatase/5'-nucleotidase [Lentisphaerae bacterium]|jgi:hypothetical protein|nr:bifunctional metallophosphatase/5'-nucleotidase [Lentisphaerota bacterium]MBT4823439.1 bifunctional metallophosphatase/5'-nucleotidase [Lentisphaerota bacterium]MBT5607994.1 bifunctional metallophosphatase/5'-nucleotidase [Lentisphaerota bacterium]MBT7057521.1 bifunctional metallophosphatase/5'-nucleotidase [Lentisphaerota bacterium]MBT7845667.1 bifunctional metallophosphatase/5'-nucleotidase [Lentisphaerota bacterium]
MLDTKPTLSSKIKACLAGACARLFPGTGRAHGCSWPVALLVTLLTLTVSVHAAEPVTVTLYNTGDIHENTANLSRVAHFVRQRRETDPNVLFLDAGDVYNKGEIALMATRGEAINAIMQAAGYDARIFGNHGHSFGTVRLIELVDRFEVPLLAANAIWPEGVVPRNAPPYRVFKLQGVRVGVVGTFAEARNHRCDDLLKVKRVHEAVAPLLPKLRQEADIIVLVTHVGTRRDKQIAAALATDGPGSGVDVIIGGHDHAAFSEPVIEPKSDTLIQHSGSVAKCVGEVVLHWDGQRITDRRVRLINMTETMAKDTRVEAVRDYYREAISETESVAQIDGRLSREQLSVWAAQQILRVSESEVVLLPPQLVLRAIPPGDVNAVALLRDLPRLGVLTFTVADEAGLRQLLKTLWKKKPTLMTYGYERSGRQGAIRVAYPCVAYDKTGDTQIAALESGGATDIARLADISLWQIALQAARRDAQILLPVAAF